MTCVVLHNKLVQLGTRSPGFLKGDLLLCFIQRQDVVRLSVRRDI
jgi:hypothetical protein